MVGPTTVAIPNCRGFGHSGVGGLCCKTFLTVSLVPKLCAMSDSHRGGGNDGGGWELITVPLQCPKISEKKIRHKTLRGNGFKKVIQKN